MATVSSTFTVQHRGWQIIFSNVELAQRSYRRQNRSTRWSHTLVQQHTVLVLHMQVHQGLFAERKRLCATPTPSQEGNEHFIFTANVQGVGDFLFFCSSKLFATLSLGETVECNQFCFYLSLPTYMLHRKWLLISPSLNVTTLLICLWDEHNRNSQITSQNQ